MSDEVERWRFTGAVLGAWQGHAKPRALLLALLRADHPLTAGDKIELAGYIQWLTDRGQGDKATTHPSKLFTTKWVIRDAADNARRLWEFAKKNYPHEKMTLERAVTMVCRDRQDWYLKGLARDAHRQQRKPSKIAGDAALHDFTTKTLAKATRSQKPERPRRR